MIRNSTIPSIGRVGRRWASWRRSQHAVVVKRAGGICEGCGKDSRRLEVAHLCGRRNIVGEPWASWHGLCAALCAADPAYGWGCHETVDNRRDAPLRDRLLTTALDRLAELAGLPFVAGVGAYDPLGTIRQIVAALNADGVRPGNNP